MNRSERILLFFILYIFSFSLTATAQTNLAEANALLDAEQIQYRQFLNQFRGEEGIRIRLREFAYFTVDSMQAVFSEQNETKTREQINSITSLRYFLQTLRASIQQQ